MFTLLLVHLILHISPHHSHHLRSHHLSLPLHFTPYLKLISFTNPFLHSHSYSFGTAFMDLNLYCIKGALFVLVFFWLRVLDKAEYSAFESTLNSSIVSYSIYCIVSCYLIFLWWLPVRQALCGLGTGSIAQQAHPVSWPSVVRGDWTRLVLFCCILRTGSLIF